MIQSIDVLIDLNYTILFIKKKLKTHIRRKVTNERMKTDQMLFNNIKNLPLLHQLKNIKIKIFY